MPAVLSLPHNYSFVGASLVSIVWLLAGQYIMVGKYRTRAGIEYPQMYAENAQVEASKDAYLFNCAQRAHQNTLELIPVIVLTTIISGLKYPVFAGAFCGFWTLARISYTRGYLTGDPKNRISVLHRISGTGLTGALLMSTYVVGEWMWKDIRN